jgi:hypothetical protein
MRVAPTTRRVEDGTVKGRKQETSASQSDSAWLKRLIGSRVDRSCTLRPHHLSEPTLPRKIDQRLPRPAVRLARVDIVTEARLPRATHATAGIACTTPIAARSTSGASRVAAISTLDCAAAPFAYSHGHAPPRQSLTTTPSLESRSLARRTRTAHPPPSCCGRPPPYRYYSSPPSACCCSRRCRRPSSRRSPLRRTAASTLACWATARMACATGPALGTTPVRCLAPKPEDALN